MNVTAERIPDSQVVLTIEVEPERVEQSMQQAYRRVAPRIRVPGFRPGKAPRAILERHVGREALLHEALDKLVPEVVEEAIKSESLEMVDAPDLEITSLEPVVIKATVPVRPTIDLGDYRSLRLEAPDAEIDEDEAQRTLDQLRRRNADIEPVERPVQEGDRVRVSITGTVDDEQVLTQDNADLTVRAEALTSVPGVYDRLLGMSAGELAEFEATLPDDYSRGDLAGKSIHYTLTVLDVKEEKLPELDDEFAKEVGEGFDSLEALKERIDSDIRARADEEARRKLQELAVDTLVGQATVEYPPQMVEREIDHMIRDITRQVSGGADDRRTMERFLIAAGRSEEQLREEFRPSAAERVKRTLVLSQLAENEGISVTPEDIEAELDALTGPNVSAAQVRQVFGTAAGREMIERNLRSRRTLERLIQLARGEEPPAAGEAEVPATDTENKDEEAAAPATE